MECMHGRARIVAPELPAASGFSAMPHLIVLHGARSNVHAVSRLCEMLTMGVCCHVCVYMSVCVDAYQSHAAITRPRPGIDRAIAVGPRSVCVCVCVCVIARALY